MKYTLETNQLAVPTWNKFNLNTRKITLSAEKSTPIAPIITAPAEVKQGKAPLFTNKFIDILPNAVIDYVQNEPTQVNSFSLPEGTVLTVPITINFNLPDEQKQNTILDFHLAKDSVAEINIVFYGDKYQGGEINNLFRLQLSENAKVTVRTFNLLGRRCQYCENVLAVLAENAQFSLEQTPLGGKETLAAAYVQLDGQKSRSHIQNRYIGIDEQQLDFNYSTKHFAPDTHSETYLQGILFDQAEKVSRATIDFIRGCKKAVGIENENVLLLGENVKNKSVPLILCGEDDVQGTHGTSIGSLNEEQSFYLQTRGLDTEEQNTLLLDTALSYIKQKLSPELATKLNDYYEVDTDDKL